MFNFCTTLIYTYIHVHIRYGIIISQININSENIEKNFAYHAEAANSRAANDQSIGFLIISAALYVHCLNFFLIFFFAVVKQRMQMFDSPYKSCSNCIKVIYKEEGVMAFYRSFTTQLTMNIPFQCIHFMTYEVMQDIMNKNRGYDPSSHMISGAIAGAAAAVATMPLDVCKTLLNTQECCSRSRVSYVNGMTSAFRLVYEYQGLQGYFKGVQARVIFQMPATGISWSVYELFKYLLTQRQNMEDKYPRVNGLTVKAVESSEV